jgi:hypothetical protein
MRHSLKLAVLLVGTTVTISSSQTSLPYKIFIGPEKPSVSAGHEVWINVTLTNNSNREIDCTATDVGGVDRSFQYDIRNAAGKSVEKLNMHPETYSGAYQLCTLEPGKSITRQTRVSMFHDLSTPGTYKIQVSRYVSADTKAPPVQSNITTVSITP